MVGGAVPVALLGPVESYPPRIPEKHEEWQWFHIILPGFSCRSASRPLSSLGRSSSTFWLLCEAFSWMNLEVHKKAPHILHRSGVLSQNFLTWGIVLPHWGGHQFAWHVWEKEHLTWLSSSGTIDFKVLAKCPFSLGDRKNTSLMGWPTLFLHTHTSAHRGTFTVQTLFGRVVAE